MSARIYHPNLSSEDIEARAYQLKALKNILHSSTLLVLPTGMGKTPIELMAVADKLYELPHKKVIFLGCFILKNNINVNDRDLSKNSSNKGEIL